MQLPDLAWLGIDAATIDRLAPWVELLPVPTAVNVNTARARCWSRPSTASTWAPPSGWCRCASASRSPRSTRSRRSCPRAPSIDPARVGVASGFFEVAGRLRLEERVLEERSLLQRSRQRADVVVLRRERRSFAASSALTATIRRACTVFEGPPDAMSVLVIQLPPRDRLRAKSPAADAAGSWRLPQEWSFVLSSDGRTAAQAGQAALSLLPRADSVVLVLAEADVGWHRVAVPRAPAARLRAALAGVMEEALLDEDEALHFALGARRRCRAAKAGWR